MALTTITADSTPIYCWFGGEDCWTCLDLIEWHKLMSKKYGQDEANRRFLNSWNNDTPPICEQADCRSFNTEFRQYMKSVNLLSSLYSGVGVIASPIGVATDIASNSTDAIVNATKIIKYAIPVIVIAIGIGILIMIGKKSIA